MPKTVNQISIYKRKKSISNRVLKIIHKLWPKCNSCGWVGPRYAQEKIHPENKACLNFQETHHIKPSILTEMPFRFQLEKGPDKLHTGDIEAVFSLYDSEMTRSV